jgi:D-amino peptidase
MRVYVMTDLEGVSGVWNLDLQCVPTGREYDTARRLLTGEVNACVEGLLAAGATEIVVADGHGAGGLYFPDLHPAAVALLGRPKPPTWGLEEGYDAYLIVGQHARAGTDRGLLDHTMSAGTIVDIRLNGEPIGELGIYAALAGGFGIPTIMVTGDDVACAEAKELLGGLGPLETVAVKRSLTRSCGLCLAPARAQELIRAAATRALQQVREFRPYRPTAPLELRYDYLNSDPAEQAARRPNATRVGARTVVYHGDDFVQLWCAR